MSCGKTVNAMPLILPTENIIKELQSCNSSPQSKHYLNQVWEREAILLKAK